MILSVIVGVAVFLFCVVAFSIGVKFGMSIKNGVQPKIEPLKTVIQAVEERTQAKETKQKSEEVSNNIQGLFGYQGELKARGVIK